jgi:hypothetical protein
MNQLEALRETVAFAEDNLMPDLPGSSVGMEHLYEMLSTVENSHFSDAKLGRWLGWAQCAVVAAGVATLEDMKQINLKWSDE